MFQVFTHSELGGHLENQDAFQVSLHPADPSCYLFAIADGQGGQAGGGEAARLACKTCLDVAASAAAKKLSLPSTWIDILLSADRAVATDVTSGFTTLIAFCILNDWICGASSGDSALAYWDERNDGEILTQYQAKNPPIGFGGANIVPYSAHLQLPWTVAAMTDGVWKYVGWDRLRDVFKLERSEALIERLLTIAKSPANRRLQDDFTIVLVRTD
jgi:serine/threonine protein phosphatase PrpC